MNWITWVGLIAATCTTISFLPQAVKILRTRHTKDLSLWMYLLLTMGSFLWFVYGILLHDIPLIMANAIGFLLTTTVLILKIKYK